DLVRSPSARSYTHPGDGLQRPLPLLEGPGRQSLPGGFQGGALTPRRSAPAHALERRRLQQWPIGIDANAAQRTAHAWDPPCLERRARCLVRAVQDALWHVRQRRRLAAAAFVVMHEHALVVVD